MSILDFFKKKPETETRSAIGVDGWPVGLPGTNQSFVNSPDFAENLSAVFACVTAISSAISALPVLMYQKNGKRRLEVEFGALRDLFQNPNPYQSWPEFCEMLVAQILLRGNGLVDTTAGLRVIPWNWCNVSMLPSGRLVYDVYDQPGIWAPTQGKRRRLLQHEAIHIRDRSDDGLIGKSRLQRAAATLTTAQAVATHAETQFRKGMSPGGLLTTPAKLSEEATAIIRQNFDRLYSGSGNAGKLLMLPGPDFDFKLMHVTPEDAELLASRKFSVEEISRIFQVPPPIIQDYSHNTFTNSAQASRWFSKFCLLPMVKKIEASFNRALFPGGDHEMVLDMSAYDRADPESRWQAHAIAASNGILDINEIREVEGWSPRPGGNGNAE